MALQSSSLDPRVARPATLRRDRMEPQARHAWNRSVGSADPDQSIAVSVVRPIGPAGGRDRRWNRRLPRHRRVQRMQSRNRGRVDLHGAQRPYPKDLRDRSNRRREGTGTRCAGARSPDQRDSLGGPRRPRLVRRARRRAVCLLPRVPHANVPPLDKPRLESRFSEARFTNARLAGQTRIPSPVRRHRHILLRPGSLRVQAKDHIIHRGGRYSGQWSATRRARPSADGRTASPPRVRPARHRGGRELYAALTQRSRSADTTC